MSGKLTYQDLILNLRPQTSNVVDGLLHLNPWR
jgi:hypothetical protein